MDREIWSGCYKKLWGKKIVKEAYTHPAKFSHNLIYRIIQEGLDRGWWNYKTIILDPFAGVGLGGITATDLGVPWTGVELEQKFVDLAWENFDLHLPRWLTEGKSLPKIIQGDSRNLIKLIRVIPMSVVTSPPFSQPETRDRYKVQEGVISDAITRATTVDKQGTSEGNIAIATSPPYEGLILSDGGGIANKMRYTYRKGGNYGNTGDNIGQQTGETYWDAIGTILEQLYTLLPKEGHVAWVVKPFVRKGQIVDLPQMTLDLMIAIGFTPVVWVDADFEGRKSFFRRLQESKGAPPINYETVLVVKK